MGWHSGWNGVMGKAVLWGTPGWECCKSSLVGRESDSSSGLRPGDVVSAGHGAAAPPDKGRASLRATPGSSWAVDSCLGVVSPLGSSIPEGLLCLGKCWCKANQSPPCPQPCFSWEEISLSARTCRDFVPGMCFPWD